MACHPVPGRRAVITGGGTERIRNRVAADGE
jgi:hypothetical protein